MCGNFGLLSCTETKEEKARIASVLRAMAAKTELRGALGGGIGVMTWEGQGVPNVSSERVRIVPGKRDDLSWDLLQAFLKITKKSICSSNKPTIMSCVGHTRYPTSSRSVMTELHPHLWTPHHNNGANWFPNQANLGKTEPPILQAPRNGTARSGLFLCHNGDFDEYELFGQNVSYVTVGKWLARVMHAPDVCLGDSPKAAGMMELLTTKGSWIASVRWAFQKCIADSVGDAADGDPLLSPESPNTAPSVAWCARMGQAFSKIWVAALKEVPEFGAHGGGELDRESNVNVDNSIGLVVNAAVSAGKMAAIEWSGMDSVVGAMSPDAREQWVVCTVDNFLHGDLFTAMTEFMSKSHGSFGLQAISTTQPGVACIAAKGQSMRLAILPQVRSAIWGSEGMAVEVPVDQGGDRYILRLDSVKGQLVEIKMRDIDNHTISLEDRDEHEIAVGAFSLKSRMVGAPNFMPTKALKAQLRLVKPVVPKRLPTAGRMGPYDPVLEDLRAVPSVLEQIVNKWRDGVYSSTSPNRISANKFVGSLSRAMKNDPSGLHLLVVGMEVSLFVSEQFAGDVTEFIPGANAMAISSNQLIGDGKIYFSHRDSKGSLSLDALGKSNTVVLVVSQSGQTFPSLKATARLVSKCHDRVFVMVGGSDGEGVLSEMGSIVMDHHKVVLERNGSDHVFTNLSGNRPCEASSVAVAAAHHSLTELLVYARLGVDIANDTKSAEDFRECILALTKPFLENMRDIVGCHSSGKLTTGGIAVEKLHRQHRWIKKRHEKNHHSAHEELVAIGWRWGQHISEGWRVMFLSGTYILIAVIFGMPLFYLLLVLGKVIADVDDPGSVCWGGVKFPFSDVADCGVVELTVGTVVSALDAVLFIMFPVLVHRIIRFIEGRPLYHRFGKRCIIVADVPWISKCTESFIIRLYSLAYGFCSPEVHSADPVDHMIHDQAPRSVRGLLVAVGRPDGRLFSFTKTEAAVILATKQMSFVENLGQMPEVMSIGSNPHFDHNVYAHIALPSATRPKFVDEFLYSQLLERQKMVSDEPVDLSPRKFLKGLQGSLKRSKAKGGGVADTTAMGGVLGLEALLDMSNSMSASSSGLQKVLKIAAQNMMDKSMDGSRAGRAGALDSSAAGGGPIASSGSGHHDPHHHHHEMLPHGTSMEGLASSDINVFQSNLDARTGRFLGRFSLSQRLLEARFNSLERFISFCVMFHASAESVNHGLWGLYPWDTSRSQSHMRINTTACPVMDTLTDMAEHTGSASIARAAKLKEVKAFSDMPPAILEMVAMKCTVSRFHSGAKVVQQGAPGDTLYVLESGHAVLVLEQNGKLPVEVGQINAGDHFSEAALIKDNFTQPASVIAITAVKLLKLSKFDLLEALGAVAPNQQIMNQSIDESSTGIGGRVISGEGGGSTSPGGTVSGGGGGGAMTLPPLKSSGSSKKIRPAPLATVPSMRMGDNDPDNEEEEN